jgi:DNA-binding beta-propeller fold protein YncE
VDVTPDGKRVHASGIAGSVVDVADAKSLERAGQVEGGAGPHGLRTSADGERLYVALSGTGRVAAVETESLTLVREIDARELPFWVAVAGNR